MGPAPPAPMTRAQTRALTRAQAKPKRAVFVDGSGRRVWAVRALALAGVVAVCAYVGLVVASFFGVPSIVSPLLPPPIAEKAAVAAPTPTVVTPTPGRSPSPVASAAVPVAPVMAEAVGSSSTAGAAAVPAPSATPVVSPTPTPTAADHGKSSTAPGKANPPTPSKKP